jgi:putative DNA primase/helicase
MNIIELRAIKPLPSGKNDTYVGYYDDPEIFAAHAKQLNNDGYHIYSPFNPIKPGAITELNQPPSRRRAVRKQNIERRVVLPYDYDVERPAGQAASDTELKAARAVVQKRVNFWRERGVVPLVKHSGNGFQLEVPIDLPNDAATELLIKKVLQVHKTEDDAPGVHLDCWKDANRIFRVPGYINWKGDGSAERPHRTVKLLNEPSGIATREVLEAIAKDWTKLSPSSGTARGTGAPDQDALTVLKAAYLRSGRVWSALKAARKQDLKLNGDHSTITAFANFLNNSWEEDRENYDGIVRVLETIWDECGTSSDGGRTENEVEDIVNHAFAKDRKPWVVCDSVGPLDPPYVPPAFVWSSPKGAPPALWVFADETEFAVFKHRVEQTPAWAYAAKQKDPDEWCGLPADYEAWKKSQKANIPTASDWSLVRYTSIAATTIDWMWKGYLAIGKLTMLNGEPGSGKSFLSLDIAARVSRGTDWPDGTANSLPPSSVLVLTEEEDPSDTIKPRFLAAGGDPANLIMLNVGEGSHFQIEKDTPKLRKMLMEVTPPVRLLILDPVLDYTKINKDKDDEVRTALNTLKGLAKDLGAAVLGINHLNKKTDQGAIHRVAGARGWVSYARLNFLVGLKDGMRHLVTLKTNIVKNMGSFAFTLADVVANDGSLTITGIPVVRWQGKGELTPDDLMTRAAGAKEAENPNEIITGLQDILKDGKWRSAEWVIRQADDRGWQKRSVQRAADKMGIEKMDRPGKPPVKMWKLPLVVAEQNEGAAEADIPQ